MRRWAMSLKSALVWANASLKTFPLGSVAVELTADAESLARCMRPDRRNCGFCLKLMLELVLCLESTSASSYQKNSDSF